ncbi:MAG TPA: hypothetical protein PLZ86_03660 [bacterium]|nr:hypothetical protein [bacterium]
MSRLLCVVAFSALLSPSVGAAQTAGPSAAVFASERIMERWVGSYFSSLPDGSAEPNECERVISRVMSESGFELPDGNFVAEQRLEAKRARAVFARYPNLSSLPNETAAASAAIVLPGAKQAVCCGVKTFHRKAKRGKASATCAEADCKAVDTSTMKRVATGVGRVCETGDSRTTAGVAAMRRACRQAGEEISSALSGRL